MRTGCRGDEDGRGTRGGRGGAGCTLRSFLLFGIFCLSFACAASMMAGAGGEEGARGGRGGALGRRRVGRRRGLASVLSLAVHTLLAGRDAAPRRLPALPGSALPRSPATRLLAPPSSSSSSSPPPALLAPPDRLALALAPPPRLCRPAQLGQLLRPALPELRSAPSAARCRRRRPRAPGRLDQARARRPQRLPPFAGQGQSALRHLQVAQPGAHPLAVLVSSSSSPTAHLSPARRPRSQLVFLGLIALQAIVVLVMIALIYAVVRKVRLVPLVLPRALVESVPDPPPSLASTRTRAISAPRTFSAATLASRASRPTSDCSSSQCASILTFSSPPQEQPSHLAPDTASSRSSSPWTPCRRRTS